MLAGGCFLNIELIGLQSVMQQVCCLGEISGVDNPVERLNVHLSLLGKPFVPTKVIRVRNKDKPWFNDDCRLAFDIKHGAHLRWTRDRSRDNWDEFVHYQRRDNDVYAEAMR